MSNRKTKFPSNLFFDLLQKWLLIFSQWECAAFVSRPGTVVLENGNRNNTWTLVGLPGHPNYKEVQCLDPCRNSCLWHRIKKITEKQNTVCRHCKVMAPYNGNTTNVHVHLRHHSNIKPDCVTYDKKYMFRRNSSESTIIFKILKFIIKSSRHKPGCGRIYCVWHETARHSGQPRVQITIT